MKDSDNIVLLGNKKKHLKIPDGYKRIYSGKCRHGDMYGNLMTYKWSLVDQEDVDSMTADEFDVLIRKS